MAGQFLRVRKDADWQAYHSIRRHVLFDLRSLSDYYDNHPDYPGHHSPLLFLWNGAPVGTVRLDRKDGGTSGSLRLVAILPGHQRQGIGKAMISAVGQLAIEAGMRELEVNAERDAVIFYEKPCWAIAEARQRNPLMTKCIT